MANQLIGTILTIGATQDLTSKNGNAFKRRDLVLMLRRFHPNTGEPMTDMENTPQLTFMGDRCAELDNYQPGQVVVVSFVIQGRKYTDQSGVTKIINDIRPFRIELYQPRTYAPQSPSSAAAAPQPAQSPQVSSAQAQAPSPQTPQTTPGGYPQQPYQQQPQAAPQGYGQQGGGYNPPF